MLCERKTNVFWEISVVRVISIVNDSISTFSDLNGWETLRLGVARWSPVHPFLLPLLPHPPHCGSSVLIVRQSRPHDAAVQGCLCSVALVYLGAGVHVWCCVPDILHLSKISVGLLETGLLVLLVCPVWSTLLSVEWRPAALPLLCAELCCCSVARLDLAAVRCSIHWLHTRCTGTLLRSCLYCLRLMTWGLVPLAVYSPSLFLLIISEAP